MYAPSRVMTNDDLATMVDTSDEWIVSRTGIRERRIAADDETTTSMSVNAARDALAVAGLDPAELDLVILGDLHAGLPAAGHERSPWPTSSAPPAPPASTSWPRARASSTALRDGPSFVRSGMYRNVLVIGVELLSRFLDYTDRNTCVLFGDGAGAVFVSGVRRPAA